MPASALPLNEARRLQALLDYAILDTPNEEAFDRLARIAAALLEAPIALISLIDGSRQWFKARVGLAASETPRDWAFCSHALVQEEPLVVLDAPADPRFADNPLVTGEPEIRFYLGAQLNTPAGETLGTLCVIDRVPRVAPDPARVQVLRDLADLVMDEMELRRVGRAVVAQARAEREIAERVQAAHRTLEAAFKAKSDFLSSLSHELRSPLNAVIGFSDLILNDPDESQQRQGYARDINESGTHMLALINDILEYSRLEAGASAFRPVAVGLRRVVEEAARMVAVFARNRGVTLRQEIAAPDVQVRGDALRLKQVLLNLLTNAIKFTLRGGTVTLSLVREGGTAVLRVRDTGIGIAPEDIAKVLTPFGQVVPSDEEARARTLREGTGLGLPIVKALVEQHGGVFGLHSTPGAGTCASVSLPALA